MNLASVEMTTTTNLDGLVALYLDVLGTVSEVIVYSGAAGTVTAEFAPGNEAYQTVYFGTHQLAAGSRIWIDPGSEISSTYIDRLFLTPPVPNNCAEALDHGYGIVGDISGPLGQPDCYVNLLDLAAFAENWLDCMDPFDINCIHP